MDKKKKTMWFRPSFIYSTIYYNHTFSLRRKVDNETMDILEREREVVVGKSWTNTDCKVLKEISRNDVELSIPLPQ